MFSVRCLLKSSTTYIQRTFFFLDVVLLRNFSDAKKKLNKSKKQRSFFPFESPMEGNDDEELDSRTHQQTHYVDSVDETDLDSSVFLSKAFLFCFKSVVWLLYKKKNFVTGHFFAKGKLEVPFLLFH